MVTINRQFLLNAHPVGDIKLSDLKLTQGHVPSISDGEILVKMEYLALEPAMRGWMAGRTDYTDELKIGDVMRGFAAGEVIESRRSNFNVGSRVSGMFGLQEYAVGDGVNFPISVIDDDIDTATYLGVLGVTGLTAYCGMHAIAEPQAGETIVVSGAAGATGSIVGQIAKLAACRVIGIAGSAEKCAWLKDDLGFDETINYKTENVNERLTELCPNGLDIFWDNVGGDLLNTALGHLAKKARIVLCGGISRYNTTEHISGPDNYFNLVFNNALMKGFVVSDYLHLFPQAFQFLKEKLSAGELRHREDILEGFEQAPEALLRLFRGDNVGKQLVRV